jgi:hypothetical protein
MNLCFSISDDNKKEWLAYAFVPLAHTGQKPYITEVIPTKQSEKIVGGWKLRLPTQ